MSRSVESFREFDMPLDFKVLKFFNQFLVELLFLKICKRNAISEYPPSLFAPFPDEDGVLL
jgi:hypothetical protein